MTRAPRQAPAVAGGLARAASAGTRSDGWRWCWCCSGCWSATSIPVVNLVDAWRDSKASEERLAELKQENRRLTNQVREAGTPLVLEREARKLGMVRPGEDAYVVRGLGD